jgi:hypothetical protein
MNRQILVIRSSNESSSGIGMEMDAHSRCYILYSIYDGMANYRFHLEDLTAVVCEAKDSLSSCY